MALLTRATAASRHEQQTTSCRVHLAPAPTTISRFARLAQGRQQRSRSAVRLGVQTRLTVSDTGTMLPEISTTSVSCTGISKASARDAAAACILTSWKWDRLVAGSEGGEYTVGNVQLLCPACNKLKGSKDMAHLKARRREQGLFDT